MSGEKSSEEISPATKTADNIFGTSPEEWDLSKAEKRWGLTLRHPSMQRKHAQHARHMPSRTLDVLGEEKINSSVLAYATKRANRKTISPVDSHAMNIVSHMEMHDELMLDDPISEQLRLDKLRDIPQCLTVKRAIKTRLTSSVNEKKKKRKSIGFWKRLKYRISISFMKIGMAMHELGSNVEIWYHLIKAIEGHFGSGVASYFKFLRWLFTFNIICCILSVGFIIFPQCLLEIYSDTNFHAQDLLTGSGFFTNSIMYYGFYSNETVSKGYGQYSIPAAYFTTFLCCYVFIFLLLSIKVARSYRKNFIETAGGLTNVYANKIFCGWDYGIASYRAANLRSATIYGELRELLAESRKRTHQDCPTRCYVLFIQVSMTLLVITIMSGTGVVLWTLLKTHTLNTMDTLLSLVIPLAITLIMNLYPAFFSWLVQFEGYATKRTALFITMIRTYIMEVVILGVLLTFWLTPESSNCWQTAFSQEIYRLIIIDFIVSIVISIAQMIRSKLYLRVWKKIGAPRFDIARNTQSLIYNQTLFWIVFYFSPLMSVIILVKLILTFYIKTYGVLNHCEPPSRSWRAAQTQTLFLALAFLSMVAALSVIGYVITSVETGECGPFQGYDYTWQMVTEKLVPLRNNSTFVAIITGVAKPGVGAGILIAMCVAVYYLRARASARKEMVHILKGMLILEAHDKDFLLRGISRVTDEKWLYHSNPVRSPRSSVLGNPQHKKASDSPFFYRRESGLDSGVPRPSVSSTNYQETSFSRSLDQKYGARMDMSKRDSVSSDDSSIHNSIKSQDAKESVVHRYNFDY